MQFFFESLKFSLRSIRSYKLRAFLTMFGISIGVFAITIVFTLVNSMQYSISRNISSLGNTVMFVHNWPWKDNSEDWYKYFNRPKISMSDYLRLKNNLSNTKAIALIVTKKDVQVKVEKRSAENLEIKGITYDYEKVSSFEFQAGRYFTPIEVENGRNVCIVGSTVATNLFENGPFLNREITVGGRKLKVIGVLKQQGRNLFGDNQDEYFVVPLPTFSGLYSIQQRHIDKVIAVKALSYEKFQTVENDVISLIRLNRGLKPDAEDNFSINKQESLMKEVQRFFDYLNTGGVVISIFSLLIGGFGIANIMFVTVKERTKEIGIQKSLGATRAFILIQFLLEAIILCLIGGLIGLCMLFGVVGSLTLAMKAFSTGLDIVVLPIDIVIALTISAIIGILSGFLPSLVASRLNPVEAMRQT